MQQDVDLGDWRSIGDVIEKRTSRGNPPTVTSATLLQCEALDTPTAGLTGALPV